MKLQEQTVREDDDGIRLDRWFKRHLPQVTHALLQKALRKGLVRLNGKKAEASTRIEAGQVLGYLPEWKNLSEVPKEMRTPKLSRKEAEEIRHYILHEDDHVLVLNKPAGLAVQGGTGQRLSVDAMLEALTPEGKEKPKLVHRLDKDTSGVLVMGKSARAAAELAKAFARHTAEKYYWAIVVGVPSHERGEIDLPLAKVNEGGRNQTEKMAADMEDGKDAVTRYRIIERRGKHLAWVELLPLTGRTHQIRVHMNAIGHPLLGDGKYGGANAFPEGLNLPKQLHLHARRLVIPKFFGKTLDVTAPLPPHLLKTWDALGFEAKG